MDIEKEEKCEDRRETMSHMANQKPAGAHPAARRSKDAEPLTVMKTLFGDCFCQGGFPFADKGQGGQTSQFINIHGVEFIGLGAVVDELTPKERVYDTLEQLTTRTERLISIGYLSFEEKQHSKDLHRTNPKILIETVPLDAWNKTYPNDNSMSRRVKRMIHNIRTKDFNSAIADFNDDLKTQTKHINRGNNRLLAGITAHNLGVLHVLAGNDDDAIPLFEEAINRKKAVFGPDHPEVSISLDEIGIQFFARAKFEEALNAFNEASMIRSKEVGDTYHPKMAMVLNNIACCNFQMGHHEEAVSTLQKARDILSHAVGTLANADLDLLHVAITQCNFGYLQLRQKNYDEARSIFEEALLIQQSVLGDNHRAIRDTLSNIEFTNAFHS